MEASFFPTLISGEVASNVTTDAFDQQSFTNETVAANMLPNLLSEPGFFESFAFNLDANFQASTLMFSHQNDTNGSMMASFLPIGDMALQNCPDWSISDSSTTYTTEEAQMPNLKVPIDLTQYTLLEDFSNITGIPPVTMSPQSSSDSGSIVFVSPEIPKVEPPLLTKPSKYRDLMPSSSAPQGDYRIPSQPRPEPRLRRQSTKAQKQTSGRRRSKESAPFQGLLPDNHAQENVFLKSRLQKVEDENTRLQKILETMRMDQKAMFERIIKLESLNCH